MKRLTSFLLNVGLFAGAFLPSMAAEQPVDALVLQLKSGETQVYRLAQRPIVVMGTNSLTIQSAEFEATLPFSYNDVQKFFFGNYTELGVDTPIEHVTFSLTYLDGATVLVKGVSADAVVGLFGVDGKTYQPETDRTGDGIVIRLNALPRGVYIIRINQQSYKITKR